MWRKGNIPPVLEWKLAQPLWKSIWWFLRKLGIVLPQDSVLQLLGIYPKDSQPYLKYTSATMFIVALFVISETVNSTDVP